MTVPGGVLQQVAVSGTYGADTIIHRKFYLSLQDEDHLPPRGGMTPGRGVAPNGLTSAGEVKYAGRQCFCRINRRQALGVFCTSCQASSDVS